MKIRNGFVSNSSSSSFIVLLPEDFDAEKHVMENFDEYMDEYSLEEIMMNFEKELEEMPEMDEGLFARKKAIDVINLFKKNHYFCEYDERSETRIIGDILRDYIIASVETGSDGGGCQLMDKRDVEKIKNILKI